MRRKALGVILTKGDRQKNRNIVSLGYFISLIFLGVISFPIHGFGLNQGGIKKEAWMELFLLFLGFWKIESGLKPFFNESIFFTVLSKKTRRSSMVLGTLGD